MTASIIITLCILLLLSYLFDIASAKIKVPSVIFLLILGWGVKQIINLLGIPIANLDPMLPILGTLGLILIVLEGSLELEVSRTKMPFIAKSFVVALLSIVIFCLGFAYAYNYFWDVPLRNALVNAIPFAVISSAIAIPSVQACILRDREFVTYESSISDILGVVFFNFIVYNEVITGMSFGMFFIEIAITLLITFVCTFGLLYLLKNIIHHVKYTPIILIIILVYEVCKMFNLPALIFILLFGLLLANFDKLSKYIRFEDNQIENLQTEVSKFRELTVETAFLIRSLFFLLFGFLLDISELLDPSTIIAALLITLGIYLLRYILLSVFRLPLKPLLFIAPRGLITILLFLSIPASRYVDFINRSLIIQVVIITALVMMVGMLFNKPIKENPEPEEKEDSGL